ncbi:MAG: TIGR02757 family protein [Bacteroidetes bacterium]|nr:TIGR02757 family protein [Bacteroidota bacterium]
MIHNSPHHFVIFEKFPAQNSLKTIKYPIEGLGEFLESKYLRYNTQDFIENDPVCIPHLFTAKADIEISGFLSATISWGQRKTIIRNARQMMEWMDYSPFDFIMGATDVETERFRNFRHRTFSGEDCIFFLRSLRNIYQQFGGLEDLFRMPQAMDEQEVINRIMNFRKIFLRWPHERRSEKHISNPECGSAAKRINMFLRWMVRKDHSGVDFGIWKDISSANLICPLDIHTGRVSRELGLLSRRQNDWKAAIELTESLKLLCPEDPVRYDYALFGLGIYENF